MTLTVKNMKSPRSGKDVPNQFMINVNGLVIFQSYSRVIATKDTYGKIQLDETYWDYSRTTGKYRNEFLKESKAQTVAKIKSGVYKLTDLNK